MKNAHFCHILWDLVGREDWNVFLPPFPSPSTTLTYLCRLTLHFVDYSLFSECLYLLFDTSLLHIANKDGRFSAELAPVEVKGKKGIEQFSVDEHPRDTTLDKLSSLKPVFKENGTVSAGNASVRINFSLKTVVIILKQ